MKIYFIFILIASFQLSSFAQKRGPVFSSIEILDYGTVYSEEDSGERTFEFTNTGDFPLILTMVKTSCGCLVAWGPKEPIAPGETNYIKVKYDITRIGIFQKSIAITSNEEDGKDSEGNTIYKTHFVKVIGTILKKTTE